jgi:signal transduction histidine kinase
MLIGEEANHSFAHDIIQGLANYVPIDITRLDCDGNIIEKNGVSIDSSSSKNFFNEYPQAAFHIKKLFQNINYVYFQNETLVDEERLTLENYAYLITDNSNIEKNIVIVSLDITKNNIIQESLNAKNLELKAIFDAIPDLYFRLDSYGTVLDYKSASVSEQYIPPDIFLNKPIEIFLPKNLSQKVKNSIKQVNETRSLVTMEYNISMGVSNRSFEARFFPLFNDEIIVIIREITDKVTFQEKILEKERLLLETQKIAKVFSFFWDFVENRITWTDEFYRMVGVSPEQIEHSADGFLEFIHPDDREMVIMEIQSCLKEKMNFYVEYRYLLPGNKIIHLVSEGQVKLDKSGKPNKMIGLTQDISLRKEYELELLTQKKELQQLLNNIEGIVSNQTTEVVLAKEKAEQANQAKTLFLANISHELKTPIHAIMSFAELGKEKADQMDRKKVEEYFSIIYDSGKRLFDLMSNILDLSKIDSGKENFKFAKKDIVSLCQEVVREMEAVVAKKNIKINIKKPANSILVEMDSSKISQVIRNLLTNAIKFSTKNSKIDMTLQLGKYELPGRGREEEAFGIKVRDHGKGIVDEEKALIFETFQQGKKIRAGTGGTGLGLSISKEIISAHGGIIYADNHPTGGAEFAFFIPVSQKKQRKKL